MLSAWWLLFPSHVDKAGSRLGANPWRCLGVGALASIPVGFGVTVLSASPLGLAKFVGAILGFGALTFSSLGAAGLVKLMGSRLSGEDESEPLALGSYIRGALALELAAAFPVIGWFITIPITLVAAFGASTLAAINWVPKVSGEIAPDVTPSQA
jgi:hypothetical protein